MFFVSCAALLCHVSLAKLLLDSVVGVGSGAAVEFRAVVVIGCCCGAARRRVLDTALAVYFWQSFTLFFLLLISAEPLSART